LPRWEPKGVNRPSRLFPFEFVGAASLSSHPSFRNRRPLHSERRAHLDCLLLFPFLCSNFSASAGPWTSSASFCPANFPTSFRVTSGARQTSPRHLFRFPARRTFGSAPTALSSSSTSPGTPITQTQPFGPLCRLILTQSADGQSRPSQPTPIRGVSSPRFVGAVYLVGPFLSSLIPLVTGRSLLR